MTPAQKQYGLVTAAYWGFTLSDGALRMLVLLHFYTLGYSPFEIASLFLFYEFFGVVTNLYGGWLATRFGLHTTLRFGLVLQCIALAMLLVPNTALTIVWVMAAQALSGIAKDLSKMSVKSAVKVLASANTTGGLYRWVAVLTGSKNALKGAGFFLGGVLLAAFGFQGAIVVMLCGIAAVLLGVLLSVKPLGATRAGMPFRQVFSTVPAINSLAAARFFLFSARDVWFVVALPVFLASELGWSHAGTGGFLALWVIGYGAVQGMAPTITGPAVSGRDAWRWNALLSIVPIAMVLFLLSPVSPALVLILGLGVFGVLFAVNSALHSYLIVDYAADDRLAADVGFYYMANASGRLTGTVLSGTVYQLGGMVPCLAMSAACLLVSTVIAHRLPTD